MLKNKISLTEEGAHLVLDITDDTGGFGLKLFLTPGEATRFGQGLLDRARFMVAQAEGDHRRTGTDEFPVEAAVAAGT